MMVTIQTEEFRTEDDGFTIVGIQYVELDLSVKRVLGVTAPFRSWHNIEDALVCSDELKPLRASKALRCWTVQVHTDNQSSLRFDFYSPERAWQAHNLILAAYRGVKMPAAQPSTEEPETVYHALLGADRKHGVAGPGDGFGFDAGTLWPSARFSSEADAEAATFLCNEAYRQGVLKMQENFRALLGVKL